MTFGRQSQLRRSTFRACQSRATFSKSAACANGEALLDGLKIDYVRRVNQPDSSARPSLCGVVKLGAQRRHYFVGPAGQPLEQRSRTEFLKSFMNARGPERPSPLPNPFTYRRRRSDWETRMCRPLFYELDQRWTEAYDAVLKAGSGLAKSPGRYYDAAETDLHRMYDVKVNAGARRLLNRFPLDMSNSSPSQWALNFHPLCFHEGVRETFILPDQLLIRTVGSTQAVPLDKCRLAVESAGYITTEVPAGVRPIGYTWQYVNRNGSPDRRFADNFQIPIVSVMELDLITTSGVQVHTAFTDVAAAEAFVSAFESLVALGSASESG